MTTYFKPIIKKTSSILNYPQNSDFLTFTNFMKIIGFLRLFARNAKVILRTTS